MIDSEPDSRQRLAIMQRYKRVAMVGVSSKPQKPSYFVATYFRNKQYELFFINPNYSEIMGRPCFSSLDALPESPELVVAFRKPSDLPDLVEQAIRVGAKAIWFQLGLRNDKAAITARDAGLDVVQDRCLKIEHARWAGGLHTAGFNSGVISSRRNRPLNQ